MASSGKCHLTKSKSEDIVVNVENNSIKNSKCGKLLCIKLNNKLTFISHIYKMCKKAGQKMSALSRIVT